MPAPPLLNQPVILVRLNWTLGVSTNNMNVLHYRYSGARPSSADLTSLCGIISTGYGASQQALFHLGSVLHTIQAVDIQGTDGQQGITQVDKAGTKAGTPSPASASFMMGLKINQRYRGGHPRLYFPGGITIDQADTQHWTTAFTSAALTALGTWLQGISGQTVGGTQIGNQCVVSRFRHLVPLDPPVVYDVISRTSLQRIAQQRKRLIG